MPDLLQENARAETGASAAGKGVRNFCKRAFDLLASAGGLAIFAVPMLIIAMAVRLSSTGPAIHWSRRAGRHGKIYTMPKFRSMYTAAPNVATHLLQDPDRWVTPLGRLLRTTSLDELPQLWSVLIGDMSLVGPRPALYSQGDLIALRKDCGVDALRPGITGWAQINGRDELAVPDKVRLDAEYLANYGVVHDIGIILKTIGKVLARDGIRH
jgi:O-antigen biosynthesis protein WbqP